MAKIGVALSGGGHRASLFGLGALLYLADAGRNQDVTSIASVSGGSLTNGYVAQSVDYATATADEVRAALAPFARRLARRGTLFDSSVTKLYLAGLVVLAVAVILGPWLLPVGAPVRLVTFAVGVVVLALYVGLRGVVCGRAFASTLFGPAGAPTRLDALGRRPIDHVICATDLHAGEHVYFSGRFVCAYRFGWGHPGDLPLHVAVQASAALPGAFPPRWLPTGRHGFQDAKDPDPTVTPPGRNAKRLALVDGGVYDNMGDQWPLGVAARNQRWAKHRPGLQEPDEVVVVNASAGLGWSSMNRLRTPLLGELWALLRDKDVLYDNGTSVRRHAMVSAFDATERDAGIRGALVHIGSSPFNVALAFKDSTTWPKRAARAKAVFDLLGGEPAREGWDAIVRASRREPTTLSRVGDERTVGLLRHAYVLAMANLHVILDYPLLKVPDPSYFERLLS
jgi:predicted acylesterase/phospholipase RssA